MKTFKKLWHKNYNLNKEVEAFETKDDIVLDQNLVFFDAVGSAAHAMMLKKIGIISEKELQILKNGLKEIVDLNKKGKFKLKIGDEDIHTKIENYLTQNYGEVGKKIHTGRSRNDQVLTAIRLFTKKELLDLCKLTILVANEFYTFAKKFSDIPMPGYTHMQKAMPYSVGKWAESFSSSLLDDLSLLETAYNLIDQSPLGSAAGFGSPINLDKNYTAELLGFKKVQENDLYCQNSRGKFEAFAVSALVSILSDLNKFASDIILFTTSEFGFFDVDQTLTTGSSIMPQKKNIDIAELIRSKVHLVLGNYVQIVSLYTNLISGFNRDLQDSKKPLVDSIKKTKDTLQISILLLQNIKPNVQNLEKAMSDELFANHEVIEIVKKGTPFREAYQFVSTSPECIKKQKIDFQLSKNLEKTIITKQKYIEKLKVKFETTIGILLSEGGEYEN